MSDQTIPQLLPQDPVAKPGEVFPGSIARLESSLAQREEAEREMWAASMRTAIKTDPALYAQADALAKQNGVTADFAMRNMDFLRGMSRMKQMRDEKIESTNPTWFRSMQSVEFARKAWDDDQLPWTEKWAKAWESGQLTTERGRLATRAMFTPGKMSQADKDALEKVSQRLQEIGPVTGFFPSAIEMIGQQASSIPKAVGAGLALGGASAAVSAVVPPATPFTFLAGFKAGFYGTLATEYFQVEAGNAYADMMAAGYDPDRAWNAAFGIGVANAVLGLGGFNLATGALRSEVGRLLTKKALAEAAEGTTSGFLRGFTKEYALKNIGGETGSEVLEELVTIAGESAARREGDVDLSPEGVASRLWEVASKTMQGMAVLGVPGGLAAGSRAQAIRLVKAKEALRIAGDLQDPMQRGAQSPLVKRDPATAEAVVDQMLTEAKQPKTVFVDAATLRDALAQADKATADAAEGGTLNNPPGQPIETALDKLERVVPGITEQIEDAASIGGDVQIPMAKLLSTIAAELPDVARVLNENLRIDAAMPSAAEATKDADEQAKQAEADEEIYAAMEAAAAKETDDVARGKSVRKVLADKQITGVAAERYLGEIARRDFEKSSTKVRDDIVEKLRASATALRYVEATTLARTISATIDVIAEKEGITPEQAWQKFGPRRVNADSLGLNSFFAVEGDRVVGDNETALNQPAPLNTDTPEFRAWFGESQAVEVVRDGTEFSSKTAKFRPRVFYHSTTAPLFTEFQAARPTADNMGLFGDVPTVRHAIFFTPDPVASANYSAADAGQRQALGARTIPVYLRATNPVDLTDYNTVESDAIEAAASAGIREDEFRKGHWDLLDGDRGKRLVDALRAAGYDSVILTENSPATASGEMETWAVFDPTQIKSVNNRGTFDPNDPNILNQPDQFSGGVRKTDTPAFKKWFGDSKVVDEQGAPRTLFRGTKQRNPETFRGMVFLSDARSTAEAYARRRSGNDIESEYYWSKGSDALSKDVEGRVTEAYASIRNPLDLRTKAGLNVLADLQIDEEVAFELAEADALVNTVDAMKSAEAIKKRARSSVDGNGYAWELTTRPWTPAWELAIVPALKKLGYDGLVFDDAVDTPGTTWAVFDPTQIKSVNNRGTFDPNDPNILRQPQEDGRQPRGSFIRRLMAVLFGERSNASTVVHEMVHWYVEIIDRLAEQGSPWAQQQFQVLLDRWKLTRPEWDAMPDAQRAKLYEDISYNAEDYFATGNAPSKELEGVFQSIRRWIVRIYGQVRQLLSQRYEREFGAELPPLTPELRGFFDRMLASEQAIEIVTAEREGATAFDPASAEKLGIDEATVADIQRLGEESKQEAKDRLSSEAVRAARFYQAKRRGADKELEAKLQASKERIRAEVEKDVSARPVYAAQTFIKSGEVVNDKGETVSAKLDTDAVRRLLGDDEKLEAYYETKATAKQEAVRDAVSAAAEVAASRAPSIGAAVDANLATLEKERQAALERIEKSADFEVRSRPIYKAIDHISQGTVALDDGTERTARLDRGAVRKIIGASGLGGAESLFSRIPSKYIRKRGQSPDVVARMFGFDNTLQFLQELAKANFERDVRTEVERGKKESGLWSKDLASQASRMAAEETAASPAAARVAFQAGAKAARAQARIERPELMADLLREYTRKGGTNPSLMAAQFRFTSAEEMLRAFLNAPPMEQAIEAETVARLEAEEPLSDPRAMRQAVEAAMHGKAAARLSSTILRAMLGNPPGVTQAQLEGSAQQAARQVLLRMPVGQISVRAFSQAEHRAAKARLQAIKSGDRAAAIDAQRKHLLQHYLTRFAIDIEKELDRFAQTVTGSYLKSRDDILKAKRNLDMVQAIRVLLGRFGAIGQAQAEDANAYMATMAQQNQAGHAELATRIAVAADGAKPWREMPLERWRIVMEEAAQLWHESKRSEQIKIQGKLLSKQAVQDEIEAEIVDTWGQPDKAPTEPNSYDPATVIASLTRLEPWTVQAAGGKMGGALNRYVYRPLKEAQVAYEGEKSSEFRWYKEWLESHEGELAGVPFDGQKWLGAGSGAVFESKAKILGLLAQLGTEGNRRNVFLGNGWATQMDGELYAHDGSPFMPKFQEMLAEMVARGILTKQDFDANQQALDHIRDNIKGRLFDVSREVFNFYPEAVEASPFDTPFGKYPGGYFPSQVDKKLSGVADRQQIDSVASMKANFKANNTAPQRGMLIKRNEGAVEPRVLDIRLLWEHIDDSLKIIHMAGPLQDVANLFKGGTMVETLRKASPAALRNIILPAIDRMARQATTAPSDPDIRRFVASARQVTSMIWLGLSPKNAAQQFTGLSNAAVYSSIPLVWGSFWKFWRNPAQAIAQIEAENPAMAVRWSDEMQALAMDVQQLLDPSRWKSVQQQATKWAFVLQRYAQMSTDAIAYMAAREKGVIDKLPDAEGIARAEAAVRLSQGEKTPLDVPRALSGHAVTQLFTQFADYPNVVLNANLAAPEGRRFAAFILTMVAPTLASSLIAIAFAGGQLGKGSRGDDTDPEDIIAKLLGDQIKGAFSMAPGIGGAVGSGVVGIIDVIAEAAYGDEAPKLGGETQLRSSPFAAASLLDTFQRLSTGGANPRDFAALGTAITKLPLMPFGNAFNYMRRVDEGKSRPSGPVDYVRGLLTGR